MRNMHGREAMETWTSDSTANHIPILKERRQQQQKIKCLSKVSGIMTVGETVMQGLTQTVNNAFLRSRVKSAFFFPFLITSTSAGLVVSLLAYFSKMGSVLLQFSKPSFSDLPLWCFYHSPALSTHIFQEPGLISHLPAQCHGREGIMSHVSLEGLATNLWARRYP